MTEQAFTDQLVDLARLFRWRSIHIRPGRTANGWATPVQGDGVGFPDLLLLRGERQVVAELKVGHNQPTDEQRTWLRAFAATGAEAYIWWPDDLDEIKAVLR